MNALLRQDQIDDANQIWVRPKIYLGNVPGTGKTRTIIAGLDHEMGTPRPLIVTPAIVRTHWHRELATLGWHDLDAIVKSYDEIVRGGFRLMKDLLDDGVDTLVCDEVHYCKHANTQRTQLLLGPQGYARRLPRVVLASGTPQPKHPGELFTQLCYVFPEVLQKYGVTTYERWLGEFAIVRPRLLRGRMVDKVVGVKNEETLKELLGEVMIRRTLDDVDLPTLDWQQLRLDAKDAVPNEWQWSGEYWAQGSSIGAEKRGGYQAFLIDGQTLDEIENDPEISRMRRRLGELKVAPVAEMLASQLADSDEKVVVFAHHRSVLNALRELLATFGVAYIDGDTGPNARDREIERFATDPRCRVFLGQNIAVGTGADGLQKSGARRGILVEPDWTASNNVQLGRRLARTGNDNKSVIMQMVVLAGTIDEAIVGQNIRETKMAEQVGLGSMR